FDLVQEHLEPRELGAGTLLEWRRLALELRGAAFVVPANAPVDLLGYLALLGFHLLQAIGDRATLLLDRHQFVDHTAVDLLELLEHRFLHPIGPRTAKPDPTAPAAPPQQPRRRSRPGDRRRRRSLLLGLELNGDLDLVG